MQDSQTGAILPLDTMFREFVPDQHKEPTMSFDERRKADARLRAAEKALQDAKDTAQPDRSRQGPVFFIGEVLEIKGGRFEIDDILPTGLILKSLPKLVAILLCACMPFLGCSTLQSLQQNPGVQAAETVGIGIGMEVATGSPAFGFVAPIAVNGLTALSNGSNPTAVTGIVAQDAPLITKTVIAAIPNSTGKTAAAQIAQAYTTAMQGLPATPAAANAVIASIASGLTKGASAAATAP